MSTKPSAELLPCPFCGAPADLGKRMDEQDGVRCSSNDCAARHMMHTVARWNHRAARGEVAVTAQEAVPIYQARGIFKRPDGWCDYSKDDFDKLSTSKELKNTVETRVVYTTSQAAVPISELRALREKWVDTSKMLLGPRDRIKQLRDCADAIAALCAKFGET